MYVNLSVVQKALVIYKFKGRLIMDVSFSVNNWKVNEIKNIDLKLEQQFYASTPYNLNDFRSAYKSPQSIFEQCSSHNNETKGNFIEKILTNNNNRSVAIFLTYIYQFTYRIIGKIQQSSGSKQYISVPNSTNKNISNKSISQPPQSHRGLLSDGTPPPTQQLQMLKQLKLKIYEIQMCKIDGIPSKFQKYCEDNIVKKIIFQYLNKCIQNISLIEILPESNQFLVFCLSMVSKSLLRKVGRLKHYNDEIPFKQQIKIFLQHFSSIQLPVSDETAELSSNQSSAKKVSSNRSIDLKNKNNNKQNVQCSHKVQSFASKPVVLVKKQKNVQKNKSMFELNQHQMKSKFVVFKQTKINSQKKRYMLLLKKQISKNVKKQSIKTSKNSIPTSKSIKTIKKESTKSLQLPKKKIHSKKGGCFQYFNCLNCLFGQKAQKR